MSVLELLLLLGVTPVLVMLVQVHAFRHGVLIAGCLYTVIRLHRAIAWSFLFARPRQGWWKGPLTRGALVFVLAAAYVQITDPAALFQLPLERTRLWLLIILLYPLLSVLPQELIYRVWLFEAHRELWFGTIRTAGGAGTTMSAPSGSGTTGGRLPNGTAGAGSGTGRPVFALPILISALFFGWVHIIYAGWFALISCTVGGLALAWNYRTNRTAPGAIWPLLLEHALYGLTMFSVGLGRYFFLAR